MDYTSTVGEAVRDTEQYRTCSCPSEAYSLDGDRRTRTHEGLGGNSPSQDVCELKVFGVRLSALGPPGAPGSVPRKTTAHNSQFHLSPLSKP